MKTKKTIIQAIVCVMVVCLIWGGYFFARHYGTDRILNIKKDDFSWVYQVDSLKTEGKNLVLRGFAFELEKNSEKKAFEIILQEIESGKRYFPEMEYVERKDVNDYFMCEYDYLQSGFEATIKRTKLNLESEHYEVLLRDAGERKTYQTGIYISKGILMYTNPLEYEPLDVDGTDLEEIVEHGVLRVYRPEFGVYIYQYEDELYWIAKPEYGFVDEDTYVQYQLYTTQIDRLPQHRLENNWYWDNIGFMFSANESKDGMYGEYRVTKNMLPKEYSIKCILTGNYVDGWLWYQEFRPYYYLEE